MLPATITKISHAFKEIKHMSYETLETESGLAACWAMKEVLGKSNG